MNNKKGYEINYAAKEIIITKQFSKAAGVIDSDEYKVMLVLRKDFTDFNFVIKKIEKKEDKVSYKGLSIDEMQRFVNTKSKEDQEMFSKVRKLAEGKKGKYAVVKKWFLDRYKENYTTELQDLVKKAKEAREAEEKAEAAKKAETKEKQIKAMEQAA